MSKPKTNTPESQTSSADARVLIFKGDSTILSNASPVEDDTYSKWYRDDSAQGLIEPPYNPQALEELVEQNNTLGPCIDAMITNIDGTGYEIERRDGESMEEADFKAIEPATQFFDECWPMMSFQTLRQKTRREKEATGNGYMEVIRNASDEIIFVGPLESKMMRIARLDAPTPVITEIERRGSVQKVTRMVRERRFAQKVGESLMWFKEFGASRDLNKKTGAWAPKGSLPYADRATEVLHFGVIPDINTPYFVPRWIGQTPSVVGSRKAEEHNLEFFDSGGIPPYLVIVQGGQLAEDTVEAVRNALNQKGAHARVQVIEAFATQGSLDKGSNVQVKVERFGGERSNDAMFQQYDKDSENRVRRAFRLPEILVGKTESMNFATAHASYLVAEAQVFAPERDSFDEIISNTLMPNLIGNRDYVYRSKPISIIDAQTKLNVIQSALGNSVVDQEHLVTLLGEVAGVEFQTVEVEELEAEYETDDNGNVIPINSARRQPEEDMEGDDQEQAAKSERQQAKADLSRVLGCTLALMSQQSGT